MEENKVEYNGICVGRYSEILTMHYKEACEMLPNGTSMEEFIELDRKLPYPHLNKNLPHLIVEYVVDGEIYYKPLKYPKNSPIIQKNYFGKEVIVVYNSDNPWQSVVRTDLKVEEEINKRGLERPDYSGQNVLNNVYNYGLGFLKDGKSYVTVPMEGKPNKLETNALIVGIFGFIPPILGSLSYIIFTVLLVLAFKDKKDENCNSQYNRAIIIMAVIGLVLSLPASMMIIFGVLMGLTGIINIMTGVFIL